MAFRGKTAIVTGGASGMGRLSALRLAAGGARVAVLDMSEENMVKVAGESANISTYRCDVANREQTEETVARVAADLGPVERLTHAAAIMPTEELAKMHAQDIIRIMNINYCGTVHMVKAVLPSMLERKSGDVIMFGSIAGHVLCPHMGAYSASKAAVNIFGEQLLRETKGCGVRILLVQPPAVDTPLIDQALNTSNPVALQIGRKKGHFAKPEFIVEEIEKAIEKGSGILRPGFSAKWLDWMRRLMPDLQWKMVLASEKQGASS